MARREDTFCWFRLAEEWTLTICLPYLRSIIIMFAWFKKNMDIKSRVLA